MTNWLHFDIWSWIGVSTPASCPARGRLPTTWPHAVGLSTGPVTTLRNPDAVRICRAGSSVWFFTSGTGLLSGPEPTTIVISLVIAEVWLAGGMVASTLSFISVVDGDFDSLNLPNPPSVSF